MESPASGRARVEQRSSAARSIDDTRENDTINRGSVPETTSASREIDMDPDIDHNPSIRHQNHAEDQETDPDSSTPDRASVEEVTQMFRFLFGTWLTPVQRELYADQYRQTERECYQCDTGGIWYNSHELVCDVCLVVVDMETRRQSPRTRSDLWDEFDRAREDGFAMYRSGRRRCVGGFPSVYSWVRPHDLEPDETVSEVPPSKFYR